MKDYSQYGEQPIILSYFLKHKPEFKTVLSIGENDGETLSNVRALLEEGWSGVLFEPCEKPHTKLAGLYKDAENIHCIQKAVSTTTGEATFYEGGEHVTKNDHGLLSTLKPTELLRWRGTKFDNFHETKVKTITWADFYKDSPIKHFDFISIDAEGMDWEILKQIDLFATRTKLLCIEYNGNKTQKAIMTHHMATFGFDLHYKNGCNLIFKKA